MVWTDHPETLEQALDNLTEENWHTARAIIERDRAVAAQEVRRLREALERIVDFQNGMPDARSVEGLTDGMCQIRVHVAEALREHREAGGYDAW